MLRPVHRKFVETSTRKLAWTWACLAGLLFSPLGVGANPAGQQSPLLSVHEVIGTLGVPNMKTDDPIKKILVLGDSHAMGFFGKKLVSELSETFPGAAIDLVGICGKSELGFLNGVPTGCGMLLRDERGRVQIPDGCARRKCRKDGKEKCEKKVCRPDTVKAYLARFKPDLTVVQLGTNSMWMGRISNGWPRNRRVLERFRKLFDRHHTQCVWVTPPDDMVSSKAVQDAFAQVYEDELGDRCGIFNSRPAFRPYMDYRALVRRSGLSAKQYDKMHYSYFRKRGRDVQARWAREIALFSQDHIHFGSAQHAILRLAQRGKASSLAMLTQLHNLRRRINALQTVPDSP